jgi:hypothetical protein
MLASGLAVGSQRIGQSSKCVFRINGKGSDVASSNPYFSIAKQYSPAAGKFDERLYRTIVCYVDFLYKQFWQLNVWEREAWKYMESPGCRDLRRAVEKAWCEENERRVRP